MTARHAGSRLIIGGSTVTILSRLQSGSAEWFAKLALLLQEKHRAVIDRMQVFRPVVSHQQVRADRDLFYTALKQLHELLGGQLRVPNVALKQLDLHLLYKEV